MTDAVPRLADLEWRPYLEASGQVPADWAGKIGVYAVFDRDRALRYVGISRDIAASLKLHLTRVPEQCYWFKAYAIAKPSRTVLSEIQAAWTQGVAVDRTLWEEPLDCRRLMTEAERDALARAVTEAEQARILKDVARRVEADVLAQLTMRGVGFEVRFDPKRKSEGILDMK